ncbi:MAG TPA: phosphate ABC transporter ATP-binding protein [Archaeoglobus profundus]|nr:phosphate ABC transporter ATP-binding protein [Archaeoglobus profundus]HIP58263.1 phosphate ABC transporter ATP-binding protein [Archaeoglobus profundus]
MAIIKLKNIRKDYGHFKLNVSMEIDRGITAILGSSGAGKTTLLRIIALLESFEGEYYFMGEKANDKHRRKITMVFQNPVVFRGTVMDNILYALSLDGKPDRRKAEKILEKLNLIDLANKKAKLLSGGEKQRLCIAMALAIDREVYIFDEPTSNLDVENARIVEKCILELARKGKTVIIATHNLFQARRLADKVAFMYDGKLIEYGETKQIFEEPKNELTRRFISGDVYY